MSPRPKLCRRLTPKTFAIAAISLTIILCIYYANHTGNNVGGESVQSRHDASILDMNERNGREIVNGRMMDDQGRARRRMEICPKLTSSETDINTMDVFKDFDFQPGWMKSKEFWDKSFEDRYERQKMDAERPPLKVIIVPHSHNDPGWLKTFEHYFHYTSRQVMNHMVAKLQQYHNLTFIWSEMAFLHAWWDEAHPTKQRALRRLVESGRLEVTTGGWVMTDEANVHLYAMLDQLIEGHQWARINLGVKPKTGWSVDPFGHGATLPYLLRSSGLDGAVIQRIHYAWKQWLAFKQYGDFRWQPNWSMGDGGGALLVHNQPFDIYSIKHSCGPHPYVCLNFDFRKLPGEYTEYSIKAQPITDKNVKEKSELLLEQYAKTGSLFPHNVVLMPLGDDFRYNVVEEWDQQYTNYIKIIDYINQNREQYKAEVHFGTPREYFDEIRKRYDQYPTLKGDFFVYSDIFSEGRPAYWSGYYTTRPYMKILDRQLENSLRSAELLYTYALNRARQNKLAHYVKLLERDFEKLVKARRNLALFQHHDAITGTSKSFVMRDYGLKLFEGIRDTQNIQQMALQSLLFPNTQKKPDENLVLIDIERDSFEKLPRKTVITLGVDQTQKIAIYNSLAHPQEHLIKIRTNTSSIKILDTLGHPIEYQINPVMNLVENWTFELISDEYEVIFLTKLQPLSISIYSVIYAVGVNDQLATLYCTKCKHNETVKFKLRTIPSGDIQLENQKMKLLFHGTTGFLKSVTKRNDPNTIRCEIQFGAYRSAQFHSGAYLFMPDPNEREIEKDVLQSYREQMNIIIVSGPISSEITVVYGQFLMHSVAIFHVGNTTFDEVVHVENVVDFESPPKNRETELYMRFVTNIQNGDTPEFYTDSNGLQMQKRVKVDRIGIEGNYYPITTMAFIQDDRMRLTLLTDHAQGAAGWQPGYLEVMLDRRTLYDDSRGMGEGLVDNRRTTMRNWLLLEDVRKDGMQAANHVHRFDEPDDTFEKGDVIRTFNLPTDNADKISDGGGIVVPSLHANQLSNLLNYPAGIFLVDDTVNGTFRMTSGELPCDVHVVNLRTQPDQTYQPFPAKNALLILQRQGYDCTIGHSVCLQNDFNDFRFDLQTDRIDLKSLTGLETLKSDLSNIADIYIEPMTLKTFNLSFV